MFQNIRLHKITSTWNILSQPLWNLSKSNLNNKQKYEQKHLELQELLLRVMSNKEQKYENETVLSQDAIWSTIEDFTYTPDEDKTFANYFRRYEDLYEFDCKDWSDARKVRLLLRKLGKIPNS